MRLDRSTTVILISTIFVAGTITGISVHSAVTGEGILGNDTSSQENYSLSESTKVTTNIVAVDSQDQGVIADLRVKTEPGQGDVSVGINPLVEVDLQSSANTAFKVATEASNTNKNSIDVSINIDAGDAKIVGGPSAGAAMTLAILATLENKKIMEDVVITGEILRDGRISNVGGILPKARAAVEAGKDRFLVPDGQSTIIAYKEVIRERGFVRYKTYEPYELDLNSYAENHDWGLEIIEVSSIQEADELMLD